MSLYFVAPSFSAEIKADPVTTQPNPGTAYNSADSVVVFLGQTPPAGQHFFFGPASEQQIVANILTQLPKSTNPPDSAKVDLNLQLANYQILNLDSLITTGNLNAVAKFAGNYSRCSLQGLNKLISPITPVSLGASSASTIISDGTYPRGTITDFNPCITAIKSPIAGAYEVRVLAFSWRGAPFMRFLWLCSQSGGVDLIYPDLDKTGQSKRIGFDDGTFYTAADFLSLLGKAYQQSSVADAAGQIGKNAKNETVRKKNIQMVLDGQDTITIRLNALQDALDNAVQALQQLPDETKTKIFLRSLKELLKAETDIKDCLVYLKKHPEEDRLSAPDQAESGSTNFVSIPISIATGAQNNGFPSLGTASKALQGILTMFIGNPSIGRPVAGEIGGCRDLIIRDVAIATIDFASEARNFLATVSNGPQRRTPAPNAFPDAENGPVQSCSISGTVQLPNGTPAVSVVVGFRTVNSDGTTGPTMSPNTIPATITDKAGHFSIKNLPPGHYILLSGAWHDNPAVIEVKDAKEAKLETALTFSQNTSGGFGG